MPDDGILRLQARIESIQVAPEGVALIVLRCQTGTAVSKLLRSVGLDCAFAVLTPEVITPGAAQRNGQ